MRRKRSVMRRLAKQMAAVAREIRGHLVPLYGEEEADGLAQTICYERFAWIVGGWTGRVAVMGREGVISEEIETYVRKLQNLLNEINVADLVWEFRACKNDASDVGSSEHTDVMLYFYEEFLRAYDSTTRVRRGVYYTPQPVVAYVVKSVDELLRSHFGIREGLAGDEVQVIDPAVGTGTFLHGVIDVVEERYVGELERRAAFVRERVLPRLRGMEVMSAPHAIAQMSVHVRLAQAGVELSANESLQIVLANALEKRVSNETVPSDHVLVMLGNPPYSNFGKLNQNEWIDELLNDYKQGLTEKKTNLSDDYIKFIRLAQWQVEQAGRGIVAFVTNNSFLFGLTHRKMRETLLRSFDEIYVLNLRGDRSERYDFADDENVFNITRGVAIVIFVRTGAELKTYEREQTEPITPVYYQDLIGSREEKFTFLKGNTARKTNWLRLQPKRESYDFVPLAAKEHAEEYQHFWSLQDVFLLCNSGIQTKKDKLSIHFDEESLTTVLKRLHAGEGEALRREMELGADSSGWRLERAVQDVRVHEGTVIDVQYRPFDRRKTYYTGHSNGFLGRPRADVTEHLLRPNFALASLRQIVGVPDQCAVLATKHMLTDRAMNSRNGTPYVFPLYRYDEGDRQHNLNASFLQELERNTGLAFRDDEPKRNVGQFGAEDVFAFLYAMLHATPYRERYADLLRRDFPRVPAQVEGERFTALVDLGRRLVELHTMDGDTSHIAEDSLPGDNVVRAIRYVETERRLYFNEHQSFANVSSAVYAYRVGGYQVVLQWLKERRGRVLSTRERAYFLHLLSMIEEALEVVAAIDEVLAPFLCWRLHQRMTEAVQE